MRPLSEIPKEALRGLGTLCFDVDDTLTRGGVVEAEAFAALHRLKAVGITLVAVTGRPIGWAEVFAATFPIDLGVGENGAGWVSRRGGRLHRGFFHSPAEREAQAELLAQVRAVVAARMPHVALATDQPLRRADLSFDIGEAVALPKEEIRALVALVEGEGARALVSSVHVHVIAGGWDKASGIERASEEALGRPLDLERALFVGDSGNDAPAFARFPLSVGVANVREHLDRLTVPPAYVTEADRGLGFAELADRILEIY